MKLNLVPDYVRQRKVSKQVIALLVVVFLLVNLAMVGWLVSVHARLAELQQRKSDLEMQAQQVDTLYNQANQLIDSAALALGKVEWVKRAAAQPLSIQSCTARWHATLRRACATTRCRWHKATSCSWRALRATFAI